MDNLKKHLTGKKKEGEALRTALDSVYRECGEVQFEYALQHSKDIRYVNEHGKHCGKHAGRQPILF